MARVEVYELDWGLVYSDSTTQRNHIMTPWFKASGIQKFRMIIEVRNITGNFECIGTFQTSNDETTPDTTNRNLGSTWLTAHGVYYPSAWTDPTSDLAGYQLVRFGVGTRNASGTTQNLGRVRARLEIVRDV